MREPLIPVIIFSVFNSTRTEPANREFHNKIADQFKIEGVQYKELVGVHNGLPELALLVHTDYKDLVLGIAKLAGQESILLLDETRHGTLHYVTSVGVDLVLRVPVDLGQWTEINEEEAVKLGTFTYDPTVGKYYTFKQGVLV